MAEGCTKRKERANRILAIFRQILTTGFPPLPVRRLQFVQGAAQRFQLAFVGDFLVLGQLHQPQYFHHLFQRLFQRLNDLPDFANGLTDD